MYQWQDPDTGTTQFSGKPPAWYRTGENGPRIIVFEKGTIIDDTSIDISDEQRQALRQEALLKAEESSEKAMDMAREAEEMKARINVATSEKSSVVEEQPPEINEAPEAQDVTGLQQGQEIVTEEQMRALISEWEKKTTEQAKQRANALDEKSVE